MREVVVKGHASLLDFDRSFDTISKACTGIGVRSSDCTFFLALPATVSVTGARFLDWQPRYQRRPEELKHKLDLDNITTKLLWWLILEKLR